MTYDAYRAFYHAARLGSLTRAAAEMYVTQSAVSQAIRQLEGELGTPLFIRKPRGVALTPEGETLYRHIAAAMESIALGEKQVRKMLSLEGGMLTIAASDTVSEKKLLPYLDRYHALYPDVKLRVVNKTSGGCMELVRAGETELGFVNIPAEDPALLLQPLMAVHDVFVAAPELAKRVLAGGRSVTAEQLAQEKLIMLEELSLSRRMVDQAFRARGVTLAPETELGAHGLLLEFARVGLGVSCVIREFSIDYIRSGALVELPLEPPLPARGIALCVLKDAPLSTAAKAFCALLNV